MIQAPISGMDGEPGRTKRRTPSATEEEALLLAAMGMDLFDLWDVTDLF